MSPVTYSTNFFDKKKDPSFSMGKKLQSSLMSSSIAPSPNTYNPSTSLAKHSAPQFKIGTGPRGASFDEKRAKAMPAPGTYEIKSKAF